jgi:hypothetical protein
MQGIEMTEDVSDEALVRHMQGMTESDLSTLRAALTQESTANGPRGFGKKRREVNLATIPGSANDLLWSKFVRRGWLSPTSVPGVTEGQPEGVLPGKIYMMLEPGRAAIGELLAERDAELSRRQARFAAMGKFHDERARPFIAEMIATVKAAGGNGADTAALGSLFMKSIVEAIAAAGQEERVIEDISRMTRNMLAAEARASSTG